MLRLSEKEYKCYLFNFLSLDGINLLPAEDIDDVIYHDLTRSRGSIRADVFDTFVVPDRRTAVDSSDAVEIACGDVIAKAVAGGNRHIGNIHLLESFAVVPDDIDLMNVPAEGISPPSFRILADRRTGPCAARLCLAVTRPRVEINRLPFVRIEPHGDGFFLRRFYAILRYPYIRLH